MPYLNVPQVPISSLCAVALGALYIRLAFAVIALRRKHKVRLGTGQHHDLEATVRAHANFAEYVPFTLVLLVISEINAAPWPLSAAAAALLLYGRFTHADALRQDNIPRRVRGMKATFAAIAVAMLANLLAFTAW
jgi:hypothetical protein